MPNIDQLIDSIAGHELLSFWDAYPKNKQIKMEPGDQEKTSFITGRETYCYSIMAFGLKIPGQHIKGSSPKCPKTTSGSPYKSTLANDILVKSI